MGERGGQGRARDPEMEPEDEQRVQRDVQKAAGGEAHHGKRRLALEPQKVVHGKAGAHQRRSQQNEAGVILRIGQNGGGGAQRPHQRVQKQKAQNADHRAAPEREEERRAGKAVGAFGVLLAQKAAQGAARAHADHKAERLKDRHQAEHHAHRPRGAGGADLAHKKGVGQIIDRADQHAGDGGRRQCEDQFGDRGLGHALELYI